MGSNDTRLKRRFVKPDKRLCEVCKRPIRVRVRPAGRPALRGCCVRKYHPSCARLAERRSHRRYVAVRREEGEKRGQARVGSLAATAAEAFPGMTRLAARGFGVEFSSTPATFVGQALYTLWLNDYNPGLYATRSAWWVAVTVQEDGVRTRRCSAAPPGMELHLVLAALLVQLLPLR